MERNAFGKPGGDAAGEIGEHVLARGLVIHRQDVAEPLGEHPAQPGLWLAVGHEGLGVTTAPGSARLLAAQLFGETPPLDPTPYLPRRFLFSSGSARP